MTSIPLFSRLKHLFPTVGFPMEDFLTEIIAHVAEANPKEFVAWLRALGVTGMGDDTYLEVHTQFQCEVDMGGVVVSKFPDIVLHLSDRTRNELVFLESKVASDLSSPDQLQLYAKILSNRPADKRTLLFITRDYNPQEPGHALALVPENNPRVDFIQTRWHSFSTFWNTCGQPGRQDPISRELIRFMKEHQLTQDTQLTPQGLLALGGFHQAYNVLRSVLDGELKARVKKIGGSLRDDYDTSVAVIREQFFLLRNRQVNVWIGVGFWLPAGDDGFPSAYGEIVFDQKSQKKAEIITALKRFSQKREPEWNGESLTDVAPWGRVVRDRSLASFLGESNHVSAMKAFFNTILDDIEAFKSANPGLPWQAE